MVQVPKATRVNVVPLLPLVEQIEASEEEKETVRPEDAEAERVTALIPSVLLARDAKVIVWVAWVMVIVVVVVVSR